MATATLRTVDRLGGYVIERVLGRGGMGTVFLARGADGTPRAIKVPAFEGPNAADRRARFEREARAVAKLKHPGIVRIDALGEENGVAFCVFELVDGDSLAKAVGRGPLAIDRALAIGEQLARALAHAHAHGIIHRDVKPSNVILRPDGTPVLMDFGLAREEGSSALTRTGAFLGTAHYMAPEQVEHARESDHRADIYSLGATLHELLTGAPPFEGATTMEILGKVTSVAAAPPSLRRPEVTHDVDTIVLRTLEKSPAKRYQDAASLAEDLARARRGERIGARRSRSRLAFAIAAVTLVAVTLVVLGRGEGGGGDRVSRALASVRAARSPWLQARLGLEVPSRIETLDAALHEAEAVGSREVAAAVARARAEVAVESALARGDEPAARAGLRELEGGPNATLLGGLVELAFGDPTRARDRLDTLAQERATPPGVALDAAIGAGRAVLATGDPRAGLRRAADVETRLPADDGARRTAVALLRAHCHAALAEDAARRAVPEETGAALDELTREAPALVTSACAAVVRAALAAAGTRPAPAVFGVLVAAWERSPRAFADPAFAKPLLDFVTALYAVNDVPATARVFEMACASDPDAVLAPEVLDGIVAAAGFNAFMGKKVSIDLVVDLEIALLRIGELSRIIDGGPSSDTAIMRELERRRARSHVDWAIDGEIAWRARDHEYGARSATRALAFSNVPPRARACLLFIRADHLQALHRPTEETADLEAALAAHFGRPDSLLYRLCELRLADGKVDEAVRLGQRCVAAGDLRVNLSSRGFASLGEGQPPGRPLSPASTAAPGIRCKCRLGLVRALIRAHAYDDASARVGEILEIMQTPDILNTYAEDLQAFARNLATLHLDAEAKAATTEAARLRRR
jgi:hypothetical protein